jgi:formate/nitrite transporter FocA (FNT family)
MDPSTLGPAAIVQAAAVFLIQKLKQSKKFPWLTQNSALANRAVAFAIAFLAAAGITYQWDAAQGQLIINGLMFSTVVQGLWTAAAGIITNELVYMVVQIKAQATSTGETIGAPPIPTPPPIAIPDKPPVAPMGTTEVKK